MEKGNIYGISTKYTDTPEYIQLSIRVLHDILEKVLDNDALRVAVSEQIKEKYAELVVAKAKIEEEKNRPSSPCPCGCS
jgi:hypothetical protein